MTKTNEIKLQKERLPLYSQQGGRTTISPPSKITSESDQEIKILASNIDTLRLSFDIKWNDPYFFAALKEAKSLAQLGKTDYPLPFLIGEEAFEEYSFDIKPHGSQGYEWILNNPEYSLLVGNWVEPQSRPSLMATIRSENLWYKGPRKAVHFITSFLEKFGAEIVEVKISRLDLCVDSLFPEKLWNEDLLGYRVTRASDTKIFHSNKTLTGIAIGKGMISARLYDKALEIKQQSNKIWFYDVWGLNEVPENKKIIRTEFQLRREAIKQLGIKNVYNLFDLTQEVWAYCTIEWLKFQNSPGKQSHQRKTFGWWKTIQDGLNNIPAGSPLVRKKAIKADQNKLSQQIIGFLSSFAALELQNGYSLDTKSINFLSAFEACRRYIIENNLMPERFSELVTNKKAKYQRIRQEALDLINTNSSESVA